MSATLPNENATAENSAVEKEIEEEDKKAIFQGTAPEHALPIFGVVALLSGGMIAYVLSRTLFGATLNIDAKLCITVLLGCMSLGLHVFLRNSAYSVIVPVIGQIRIYHTTWMVPLIVIIIAMLLEGQNEVQLECSAEHWSPMISPIALLYMPFIGYGAQAKETLLNWTFLQPFFFPNLLQRRLPSLLFPTMDHYETDSALDQRRVFFIPNITCVIFAAFLLMNFMAYFSKTFPGLLARLRKRFKEQQQQPVEKDDTSKAEGPPNPLVEPLLTETTSAEQSAEQSADHEQKDVDETKDGSDEKEEKPKHFTFERTQVDTAKKRLYRRAFLCYYVLNHLWLHIFIDVSVAGGFMNAVTGLAFELWSMAIIVELFTHFLTAIGKCVECWGLPQQQPAILLMPVFLPCVGNFVHLLKDHTAQGLCFAVGHCKSGLEGWVGVCLGYLSILSTFYPLPYLLATEECREGLRQAHWTLTEAGPPAVGSPPITTLLAWQRMTISTLVGMCTEEKLVRATRGEIPHTVLHILFAFFFGGSKFIAFAIMVSALKIALIPILREFVLAPAIKKYGCNKFSARKYLINGGDKDVVAELADKMQWIDLLGEFFHLDPEDFVLTFRRDADGPDDLQKYYPTIVSDNLSSIRIQNGMLIKDGMAAARNVGDQLYPGMAGVSKVEYKIEITCNEGQYNIGLGCYVGDNCKQRFCFHPGMGGGQFRIEGPGGFNNQNIGFTPYQWKTGTGEAPLDHFTLFTITLDAESGNHTMTLEDLTTAEGKKFTNTWSNPQLWKPGEPSPSFGIYAGDISGSNGGQVLYKNFSAAKVTNVDA